METYTLTIDEKNLDVEKFSEVENKIIRLRNTAVLLGSDVAELVKNFDQFKPLKHSTANPKALSPAILAFFSNVIACNAFMCQYWT